VKDFWEKMSKIVLFLLLLFIPTQLGRHFWFDWSLVWGIRIDYLSPTLYLIDLIWLGLFLVESLLGYKVKNWFNFKNLLVLVFVVINILMAQNRWVAVYKWCRWGELVWFGWYVAKHKRLIGEFLKKIIPWWLIMEGLLAIGQMSKGGSLNGWWWFLGERKFDFNTIGIAQMSVVDMGLVRAYGTFSHPNSLAGFLLVGLIWWWKNKSLSAAPLLPLTKGRLLMKNVWWWGVTWFGLIGIILSGSRTIWCLTIISIIWFLKGKFKSIKNKGKIFLIIIGLFFLIFKIIDYNYPIGNFLGGWDENGLIKRGQLNLAALGMIQKSPWFGVGMGNFLVNLPEFQRNNQIFWFQPVHNILLLSISEIGVLGFIGVFWLLKEKIDYKKWNKETWLILGVIFVSGMVDHYWFTLPQNMWLLVLVLGMI
jgi:hypothetical protein